MRVRFITYIITKQGYMGTDQGIRQTVHTDQRETPNLSTQSYHNISGLNSTTHLSSRKPRGMVEPSNPEILTLTVISPLETVVRLT